MPKDQIGEYEDRGLPLECLNLFDFVLNTYDTKKRTPNNDTSMDTSMSEETSSTLDNTHDTDLHDQEFECNIVRPGLHVT